VHPQQPKVGLRTTRPDAAWHVDTTAIRLLDGAKAYVFAVIDNFSRRILAFRVADPFEVGNTTLGSRRGRASGSKAKNAPLLQSSRSRGS
jgi:hypothetical protein